MRTLWTGLIASGVVSLVGAASLAAQSTFEFRGSTSLEQIRVRAAFPGGLEELSSAGFGLRLWIDRGPWTLALKYRHANLSPSTPGFARDMGEGEIYIAAHATPWLAVGTGLLQRRYETSIGTQRWLLWNFLAEGHHSIIDDYVDGFGELRYALVGGVTLIESFRDGAGAQAGLRLALPWKRMGVELAYRIDYYRVQNADRRETTEGLTFALTCCRRTP